MAKLGWVGLTVALCVGGALAESRAQSQGHALLAVARLEAWLDRSESGPDWRRFLKLNQLKHQVQLGEACDFEALLESLEQFNEPEDGLELAPFVDTRVAISKWLVAWKGRSADSLTQAVRAARSGFLPVSDAAVERRRQRLLQEMRAVDAYLQSGGEAKRAGWRAYLLWESLEEELEKESPSLPQINKSYVRFREAGAKIQRPAFLRMREALLNYGNSAAYARSPRALQRFFFGRLETLGEAIAEFEEKHAPEQALRVGELTGEIREAFQAPDLVAAIQVRYWRPNAFISVSDRLASAGVNTRIQQQVPVSESVRGTQILGQAQFSADLRLHFVRAARPTGVIQLVGSANATNVGIRKRVRVYSVGTTYFQAAKPLFFSTSGLTTAPATAGASTQSQITGVSHWLRLVRRIAGRIAEKARPEGEQMASDKVAEQVRKEMDDRAGPFLDQANEAINGPVQTLADNWDVYPRWIGLETVERAMHVGIMHVTPLHLAAVGPPPPAPQGRDLVVRVHESLVANGAASVLGGKKFTRERIVELLQEFDFEVPSELTEDSEPFEITFRDAAPLTASFRDGKLQLMMRASAFKGRTNVSDVELRDNLNIWADYELRLNGDGSAALQRIGEVQAEFEVVARGLRRPRQNTILEIVRPKAAAAFKEEIPIPAFTLPGGWERAGKLRLKTLESRGGWLVLGWEQTVPNPIQLASEGL